MSESYLFENWQALARVLVVGTFSYVGLLVLLRASGKRTLASMNAFDFVVTVAIGATFGRALTAEKVSVSEVLLAFTLLIGLQYAVSWLKVRSSAFARLITAPPALLFYQGRFLSDVMLRERLSKADLETAIRKQGLGSFQQVEAIVLEANGKIAVIKPQAAGDGAALPPRPRDTSPRAAGEVEP